MNKNRILIVEDETSILMALTDDLTVEGYEVESAKDGNQALELARSRHYDLLILDVMLPGIDGLEVCRTLRADGLVTPILMLTAKSQEIDKVLGLELGADDYVSKPFSPRELLARIRALLRRSQISETQLDSIDFGDVQVDFKKFETTRDGKKVELTAREYELLRFLVKHKDRAVDRNEILNKVWGVNEDVYSRTVDTHVANLRKKLEADPAQPRFIVGVRGVGYRFAG